MGFNHNEVALSVGVQKMVRSDKACSGIGFTLEPESGFKDIVQLSGVYGLGENIVQGTINPDEYYIFKPTLKMGKRAIVQKKLGDKEKTMVYAQSNGHASTTNIDTPEKDRKRFVLSDDEIVILAKWAVAIEEHYGKAMDIEWAKDGITGELFITQARPETVQHLKDKSVYKIYKLKEKGKVLVQGNAIGSKIYSGRVRILDSPEEGHLLEKGEILVTNTTSPDWDPLLKKAGAIITNRGGRTSHAAIVARELGVPAIVGTTMATDTIATGDLITISCAEGKTGHVYEGKLQYDEENIDFTKFKLPKTEVKFILSDPERAFSFPLSPIMEWDYYVWNLL
jgi:pyruvate, water dikinase